MDIVETVVNGASGFSPLSYLLGRIHENLINIDDCLCKMDVNKALMETHGAIKEIKDFVNNMNLNNEHCVDESKL